MSDVQILTVILSTSSTLMVVLVGFFLHTRQIDSLRYELRAEIGATHTEIRAVDQKLDAKIETTNAKIDSLRAEIRAVDQKLDMFIRMSDERFKILLQKIEEIDSRMARMEQH